MPEAKIRAVDVYAYRIFNSTPEYLLLRRSPDAQYAGQWRMIGGKIEEGETAWQTALREILEETGLHPTRLWAIPSTNAFYEWEHDRVNIIPAFGAEVAGEPTINREHDDYRWMPTEKAAECLRWPEQRRLLTISARMVADGIPPELVIRIEEGLAW